MSIDKMERCYCDIHIQEWYSVLTTSPIAGTCCLLKTQYEFSILSFKHRIILTRIIPCNIRLKLRQGWLNIYLESRDSAIFVSLES